VSKIFVFIYYSVYHYFIVSFILLLVHILPYIMTCLLSFQNIATSENVLNLYILKWV